MEFILFILITLTAFRSLPYPEQLVEELCSLDQKHPHASSLWSGTKNAIENILGRKPDVLHCH